MPLVGHRTQPTDPMHGLAAAIDERIYPVMLSKRIGPTQTGWTPPLLLLQERKQGYVRAARHSTAIRSVNPASLTKVLPPAFRPRGTRKAQDAVLSSLRLMHL